MAPINMGKVKIGRPLANAIVTVQFTPGARVRLAVCKALIWAAIKIAGGDVRFKQQL